MADVVTTIGTVEIPVAELPRAIRWYKEALNFHCDWSDEHHAILKVAEAGAGPATKILLVETKDDYRLHFHSTHSGIKHSVIDFETNDIESFHRQIKTVIKDLPPIPKPAHDWAPRGFSFDDSEGNQLAVFSYNS